MSGVGKGLTTASMGKIMQQYGYQTTAVKIDPYINFDAGTLRPTEHGEVWVTDDGGEIDQDLATTSVFSASICPARTTSPPVRSIMRSFSERETASIWGRRSSRFPTLPTRSSDGLAMPPMGTISCSWKSAARWVTTKTNLFCFAVKALERDIGKEHFAYVLITYLPVPPHVGEMKTKPTQQAIRMLSEHGIFPDFIVCRAATRIDEVRKKKIEIFANVPAEHIISAPDMETIYDIPLELEAENFGSKLMTKLGIEPRKDPEWSFWEKLLLNSREPASRVKIAMVGKYVETGEFQLTDSYLSVNQSLVHAGVGCDATVDITWIDGNKFENGEMAIEELERFSGIIVPGAFGGGGAEGVIAAIQFARENGLPFLGLCYGLQLAVVEYARNVAGIPQATSAEFETSSEFQVVSVQENQKKTLAANRYGGSMRLGAYAAVLKRESKVVRLYEESGRLEEDARRIRQLLDNPDQAFRVGQIMEGHDKVVLERHRHRYEISAKFVELLEDAGLVFSGYHRRLDGTRLMEFLELGDHRYFVATQAHPEFKSRMDNPAPLFAGFVEAALSYQEERLNAEAAQVNAS